MCWKRLPAALSSVQSGRLFVMKHLLLKSILSGGVLVAACFWCPAGDWSQYRGPDGAGISTEKISTAWPAGGPKLLWRVETPAGFSSFALGGGKAFTIISRNVDGRLAEVCLALDADSGKELWAAPTGIAKYRGGGESGAEGNKGGDGPRSTPAVGAGRVYVYSSDMVLHCLDAATGKSIWKKDIIREFDGKNIGWNSAMSPLADQGLVYVAGGGPGRSLLAFRQDSGELAWKSGDALMTHASPVLTSVDGVRQVVFLMQSGLVAVDASKGTPLWQFPFPHRVCTACSPVVAGDVAACTAGYDIGGAACRVSRNGTSFQAGQLWRVTGNSAVAGLWSTPVQRDGYLYGMISFKQFGRGPLKCVDLKTGEVKWAQPGFGAGQVLLAANGLLALADDGHLVLVEPNPAAYKELARFKALAGKCWSTPALSQGRLYVRSTKEGACFDLAAPK
jgi:outer membrane protein assembly factor BamB